MVTLRSSRRLENGTNNEDNDHGMHNTNDTNHEIHNSDDSDSDFEMHNADDSDYEIQDSDCEMQSTNNEGDKSFVEDEKIVGDEDEDENFVAGEDQGEDQGEDEDEELVGEDEELVKDKNYNDCHGHQCEKVFEDRESLLKHIKVCAACPFKYERTRNDPEVQITPAYTCEHCGSKYVLESSLLMHIEAKHAEHKHACLHEDCEGSTEKFSDWALNLHDSIEHEGLECDCPFPSCTYQNGAQRISNRRKNLLIHICTQHAIFTSSIHSLLQFNVEEVCGYRYMTDSATTYINVIQHLDIPYPDLLSNPEDRLREELPRGPRRSLIPNSSHIYEKLLSHAVFLKEEDILSYNLQKLALRPNYNGFLRYREGIRCPGPYEALSCPSEKTVSIANTVVKHISLRTPGLFYQSLLSLPMVCETCGAVRTLVNSMYNSGRWKKPGSTREMCESPSCQEPAALETQLCTEHALELVDRSSLFTPVRKAVEGTLSRLSMAAIRTPGEASEFFSNPQRGYDGMTVEETEFLRDLKDQKDVYFTDTETAGDLLLQVSVVDSKGDVVFQGHVNHGCATVDQIWALAMKCNNGVLQHFAHFSLQKAFGPPSSKKPHGHTMQWVAEEFLKLKKQAPGMKIAEWSQYPFDQHIYRKNLKRALIDDSILPPPSNWFGPMTWFRRTQPSLAGYSLGYLACLYAPSDLVWKWHDATADSKMLFDIMLTRSKKLFEGEVTVSPPSMSIQRLFEGAEYKDKASSAGNTRWLKHEQDICFRYVEEQLDRDSSIEVWDLLTGASYFLNGNDYYRTAQAIDVRLRKVVSASKDQSHLAHILPHYKAALSSQVWKHRTILRRLASRPEVKEMAGEIVQNLYSQRSSIASTTSKQFWDEFRRRAHERVEAYPGLTKQDVDLALLVVQNRQATTSCVDCNRDASGNERCHKCRVLKANRICIECQKPTNSMGNLCSPCKSRLHPKTSKPCVICGRETTNGQACSFRKCMIALAAAKAQTRQLKRARPGDPEQDDLAEDQQGPGKRPRLSLFEDSKTCAVPACENPRVISRTKCQSCCNADGRTRRAESREAYSQLYVTCVEEGCENLKATGCTRCTECHKAIQRVYRQRHKEKKRRTTKDQPSEEPEPEVPAERTCANPNCQIVLLPTTRFWRDCCSGCYYWLRSHPGEDRSMERCEKDRRKIEDDRPRFANRACQDCGIPLPSGSTVVGERCPTCYRALQNRRNKVVNP